MSNKLSILILDAVGAELKPLGFRLVKNKKWYVRELGSRAEKYQLVMLDDKPGYRICPSVSVRFEEVETVFHRTSGYEPEYQKDTPTVGIDLWSIFGKDKYQIRLKEGACVETMASQILEIFREKAQPYFTQFGTLSAVDSAINDQPSDNFAHFAIPWLRCSTGVIVAKLVARKNYDQLVSIYREMIRNDSNGYYLPRFELLLSDIAKLGVANDCGV